MYSPLSHAASQRPILFSLTCSLVMIQAMNVTPGFLNTKQHHRQHRSTFNCACIWMCNIPLIEDGPSLSLNDDHYKILARCILTSHNNVTCWWWRVYPGVRMPPYLVLTVLTLLHSPSGGWWVITVSISSHHRNWCHEYGSGSHFWLILNPQASSVINCLGGCGLNYHQGQDAVKLGPFVWRC